VIATVSVYIVEIATADMRVTYSTYHPYISPLPLSPTSLLCISPLPITPPIRTLTLTQKFHHKPLTPASHPYLLPLPLTPASHPCLSPLPLTPTSLLYISPLPLTPTSLLCISPLPITPPIPTRTLSQKFQNKPLNETFPPTLSPIASWSNQPLAITTLATHIIS